MKVNEIVNEGLWGGIKGAVKGFKQSQAKHSPVVQSAIDQWDKIDNKLAAAGYDMKDPAVYGEQLNRWLGRWLNNGTSAPPYEGTLTAIDGNTIKNYIYKAIVDTQTGNRSDDIEYSQKKSLANKVKSQIAGNTPAEPAAAQEPPAPAAAHKLAPGVEIVNQDPIMIKFQGAVYRLGGMGEWINHKNRRKVDAALDTFLDQQANFTQGYSE